MNKYQETLNIIAGIDHSCLEDLMVGEMCEEEINTLKELVDKATPKKPHHFVHEKHTRYYCPECSKRLKKSWSVCPICATRIDWSDE